MHIRQIAFLLILIALAGCGGGKPSATPSASPEAPTSVATFTATPNPVAVRDTPTAEITLNPTATFTPTPTSVPTATPTSTVTATPTTTPAPSARLAQGRYLQSIGDCEAARREFAQVVAEDTVASEVAEARYRLGLCYLRDGAPAEASGVLTQLLASAPLTDTYRTPAHFLLGEAFAGLSRWADAEASYSKYLPLVPELSALTWQRIGAARQAAGDLPKATEAYSTALRTSPDWENTVVIRRTLADLALAQKNYPAAVDQYDALRGDTTTGAWAAEMQWLAGAALAMTGDPANPPASSRQRWQAAADAAPTSPYAHRAIAALVEAGAAVDEYQRGVINFFNGRYALANAAFDRLRASDPTGRKGDAWYYAGLSYLRQDQVAPGLAELGNLIAAYPENAHWADARLTQADTQARGGDVAGAVASYRQLAEQRPTAPQAPIALWRAGTWLAETGDLAGAAETYLDLARRYPAADEGWRAYQVAGLIYFQGQDWSRAAAAWKAMSEAALEPFTRPVAYFWLGRAQAAAGNVEAARQSWQQAVAADAQSYYGLRAAAWLQQPTGPATGAAAGGQAPNAAAAEPDRAELSAWLKGWAGEGSLALPAVVTGDPDWRRGSALLELGRRSQALAAWGRVQAKHAQAPWTLAALALAFREASANRLSILSAEQLTALAPAGSAGTPPLALRQLAYPLPFGDLIRHEAASRQLDPLLVASVIRQESRFEPAVTSVAGAGGLMQLMPGTAEWVAGRLGRGDFEAEQAYWPYVNVAFGAYYLDWALDQLDGNVMAALSGYNGGPGNAVRWRALAPADDDLMVALIDYGETRIYVQQVTSQYETYRRIYGTASR